VLDHNNNNNDDDDDDDNKSEISLTRFWIYSKGTSTYGTFTTNTLVCIIICALH